MLQANRILCPVNPAAPEHPALDQGLLLAEACGAVLYVVPLPAGSALAPDKMQTALAGVVRTALDRRTSPPDTEIHLLDAPASAASLIQFTADEGIDLVVIDTPPDRGPIPALASEPTHTLVKQLPVPVYVVERSGGQAPKRILVPTDFSSHALMALEHARALALRFGAQIDLLHVMDRPQYIALNATDLLSLSDATLPERKARRRALHAVDDASMDEVPVTVHIRHGDAADQIGHFAREHDSDLLVLSTHGTISRTHHPLGHVAEKVLRRIARPVFLTRAFGTSLVATRPNSSDGAASDVPPFPSNASSAPRSANGDAAPSL